MTGKNNDSNRRRRWAPKARTGCRTCKTRHVKCDEAKPVCKRCVLSGFRCDGYPSLPKKEAEATSSSSDEASGTPTSEQEEPPDTVPSSASTQNSDSSLLVVSPSSPYQTNTEQHGLKFFVDMTANMVGRSRAAPYFWRTLVPQAAWQHLSVRHAILACATINQSLFNRERGLDQRRSNLAVLDHTNRAMHSLLNDKPPMDVILLTSATLGVLDLFHGSWENACMHVTSGAKLAKHARSDPSSNEYISFYCEAFASALPNVLKAAEQGRPRVASSEDSGARLYEGVFSLRLALQDFQNITPRVEQLHSSEKTRILTVLNLATTEVEWLLSRWEAMLEREGYPSPDGDPPDASLIHRVESPWSAVTQALEHYLDYGGNFDVPKFEVAMERTMPFFAMAKAGPNIEMREHAVEMMWRGIMLRGKDTLPPKSPAEPVPRVTISEDTSEEDGS